jgi:hypothetical protein
MVQERKAAAGLGGKARFSQARARPGTARAEPWHQRSGHNTCRRTPPTTSRHPHRRPLCIMVIVRLRSQIIYATPALGGPACSLAGAGTYPQLAASAGMCRVSPQTCPPLPRPSACGPSRRCAPGAYVRGGNVRPRRAAASTRGFLRVGCLARVGSPVTPGRDSPITQGVRLGDI